MATEFLQETRVISGKGVIQVPSSIGQRYARLYADVVRRPTNPYYNANYNPPRGRFCTLVFLRDGYVIEDTAMEYPRQVFMSVNDITGQNLRAIKCAYAGTLTSFANLGQALGATVVSVTNTIRDYESLRLAWDEVRVVCYGDTAIQFKLYTLHYDVCNIMFNDDHPPEAPTEAPTPITPGTPIDISPPYDDATDDNGNTQPHPIDVPPEPPPPDDCSLWEIVYSVTLFNGTQNQTTRQYKFPYGDPVITGEYNEQVLVTHSGEGANTTCIPNGYTTVADEYAPGIDPPFGGVIVSVEVVSETQVV